MGVPVVGLAEGVPGITVGCPDGWADGLLLGKVEGSDEGAAEAEIRIVGAEEGIADGDRVVKSLMSTARPADCCAFWPRPALNACKNCAKSPAWRRGRRVSLLGLD